MPIHFTIIRSGRLFNARADGAKPFFVGFKTAYADKKTQEDFVGLYNVPTKELPKLVYKAGDFRGTSGFWADFIEPTSKCEGGNFLTLNTYDRARFTWGFGQFGAHVPNGDFVKFFRDLLQQPDAQHYFPDLAIVQGRIVKVGSSGATPLETDTTTGPLLDYLNPTTSGVEDEEVIAAAKLIHWTTAATEPQGLQVVHMIEAFKGMMKSSDLQLDLDGKKADVCLVICDIRHQGRAKYSAMREMLRSSKPLEGMLSLGSIAYPDRIKTLRKEVNARSSLLLSKTWSRTQQEFV